MFSPEQPTGWPGGMVLMAIEINSFWKKTEK
jgi:hypothetical protein